MKKLNLNVASLGATEILSRNELKKMLGGVTGSGSGSGSFLDGTYDYNCWCTGSTKGGMGSWVLRTNLANGTSTSIQEHCGTKGGTCELDTGV